MTRARILALLSVVSLPTPALAQDATAHAGPRAPAAAGYDERYFLGPGGGEPPPGENEPPPNESTGMEDGLMGCSCRLGNGRPASTLAGALALAVAWVARRRRAR